MTTKEAEIAVTAAQIDGLRGLCTRLGTPAAAALIGISPRSLISLLAGMPIRPTTMQVLRMFLAKPDPFDVVVSRDVVRGETKAGSNKTKRGA